MTKKENSGAGLASDHPAELKQHHHVTAQPLQLALFSETEVPATVPKKPRPGTLTYRLLTMLMQGAALTHADWFRMKNGWRLGASVHELRRMGWDVLSEYKAPAPLVAIYKLSAEHRRAFGGEVGHV